MLQTAAYKFSKMRTAVKKIASKSTHWTPPCGFNANEDTGGNALGGQEETSGSEDLTPRLESLDGPKKLFTAGLKEEDKLVAVMVTIFQGSSYDENFRVLEPTTVPGERISTYSLDCCDVKKLHDYMAEREPVPAAPSTWAELLEDIRSVSADSVTLNWECCSACSERGFPPCSRGRSREAGTMQLMGLAVRRGYTVMCSDFSLKALIKDWSEEELGPNPFVQFKEECDNEFQLEFIVSDLQHEEVPQQLQVVGELCEEGKAVVHALGGTIMYTVNPRRKQTELYELKVLTVATVSDMLVPEAMKCIIGEGDHEKRGAAGHVTLTYGSGGQIVTSMGHWIELSRIDTSAELVMNVAAKNFGEGEFRKFQVELNALSSAEERQAYVQDFSHELVQKSMPSRMKARTKFSQ